MHLRIAALTASENHVRGIIYRILCGPESTLQRINSEMIGEGKKGRNERGGGREVLEESGALGERA